MSKPHPSLVPVYARAFAEGLEWKEVLREAAVGRATWWRMRNGGAFHSTTLDRLTTAVDTLTAAKRAASGAAGGPSPEEDDDHGKTSGIRGDES